MDKNIILSLFRSSIEGQDKNILNDPAYVFTDEELEVILKTVTPFHNPLYTLDTIPDNEVYFILLLGRKEVYYRLASSSAPYYPLEADGGGLKKNVRFEHYLALVKLVNDEYYLLLKEFKANQPIEVSDVYLHKSQYLNRLYKFAESPQIHLTVDILGEDFVNISWNKSNDPYFKYYRVYLSNTPIIDEYADNLISESAELKKEFLDIHKTKTRIEGLEKNLDYYIAVCAFNTFDLVGYSQVKINIEGV